LKKEKSALLNELGQHIAELAKPEPPPARAAQNPHAGMAKMASVAIRQRAEMQLAAMKSRLHLTDEQAEAVRALLGKQTDLKIEFTSRMYDGKLTQEYINSVPEFDFDGQLKQILTPDQLAGYQQYTTEAQAQKTQMAVQNELTQVSPLLQLSAQQQEQVSGILQQQYQQYIAQQDASTAPISGRWDQMLVAKQEALSTVLTPEQQQTYNKFVESQREMVKSMTSQDQTPPKP
jgi:hypothetical protein